MVNFQRMFQIEDAWVHAGQTALARLCGRPAVQQLPFVEMPYLGTIFFVEFVPNDDRIDGIPRRFAISGTDYLLQFCQDASMLDLRVWALGFEDSPMGGPMKEVVGIFRPSDKSNTGYVLVFDDGASASDSPWVESLTLTNDDECVWRQHVISS